MLKKIRPYICLLILFLGFWWRDKFAWASVEVWDIYTKDYSDNIQNTDIWWELLISPYNVEEHLIDIFSEAKYTIDFWLYQFSYNKMQQLFLNLLTSGRQIRWISEDRPYWWENSTYEKFASKFERDGWEVRSDWDLKLGTNFNHTKTFLIDWTIAVISTANITYSSMFRNREYRFVTSDVSIVENITYLFNKDWNQKSINKNDIHDALLVCPIDCRDKIEKQINEATQSISIQAQYLEDDRIVWLLILAVARWVDVSVMVSSNQKKESLQWLLDIESQEDFTQWWVNIMIVPKDTEKLPYIHAKNMLVDGDTLIMWSMNFSTNGLDNNREIWILTTNLDIISNYTRQWERDIESYTEI